VPTVTNSWANYYNRQTASDEQLLYAHLLNCVEVESPNVLIERFRRLFIDGVGYPNPEVRQALERIVASNLAEREFMFLLNRSCHILINRWLKHPQYQGAIPKLIALFESVPAKSVLNRTTQRLRERVQRFTKTEQYLALSRLAQVIGRSDGNGNADAKPLGTLINRYPYLYEHCLLTNDSTDEQRQKIWLIRDQKQRKFEIDLSKYITYQQLQGSPNASVEARKNLQIAKNPTLLSDRQLDFALKQFVGKVDGANTYRDLAQQFITYSSRTRSYRTFKEELYEYLTDSIDPKNGKNQFNQQLYKHLQSTLPQNDSQKLSDVLLVGTCRKLLNFLVVESSQQPNHYIFCNLTANFGITPTIGLLLKIALICRQVKPYLEKRFSILFNHYEAYTKDKVEWLVESLENLNIAFSSNFGAINFSY
jgi:hypothetical protein